MGCRLSEAHQAREPVDLRGRWVGKKVIGGEGEMTRDGRIEVATGARVPAGGLIALCPGHARENQVGFRNGRELSRVCWGGISVRSQ